MRHTIIIGLVAAFGVACLSPSYAGDWGKQPVEIEKNPIENSFDRAIRPISNPTLFDLAVPRTQVHAIFMDQSMPGTIETALGNLPLGGDHQLYALQFEYALNDRLSINAVKDGYIVFDPDNTFTDAEGFANVGAGLKYAWLLRPETGLASNIQLLYEIPMGNTRVWQGAGDGIITPSVSTLKLAGRWQFANQFGFRIPIDNNFESSMFYTSAHVSYQLCDWIRPLAEINWFHVLDAGNGAPRFSRQVGGAVPAVANFEGGDLINLGSANAGLNRNFVTGAVGFRITPPGKPYNFGVAWETPLTDENASLMENRLTVDMVYKF